MAKYEIPRPRECLNCGEKCYARAWYDSTTTGRPYGGDIVKVCWQCSYCGRRFETMEHLDGILIKVDEIPEPLYRIAYITETEENEEL